MKAAILFLLLPALASAEVWIRVEPSTGRIVQSAHFAEDPPPAPAGTVWVQKDIDRLPDLVRHKVNQTNDIVMRSQADIDATTSAKLLNSTRVRLADLKTKIDALTLLGEEVPQEWKDQQEASKDSIKVLKKRVRAGNP